MRSLSRKGKKALASRVVVRVAGAGALPLRLRALLIPSVADTDGRRVPARIRMHDALHGPDLIIDATTTVTRKIKDRCLVQAASDVLDFEPACSGL